MMFPLLGNVRVRGLCESFIKSGHFPHAILIEGEEGLGKKTLAHYLAMAAACGIADAPCGVCKSCNLARGNNHPDISFTAPEDKKKSVSVNQIRALRDEAYIKPHLDGRRVMIIDKAHTLNAESQNAFLKVLEEPPSDTVFILLAENKASLLPTVISRVAVLSLTPPERDEARQYLKEHTKADDEAIDKILDVVRNNIGRAMANLKKKNLSKGYMAAKDFIKAFMERQPALNLLRITLPLEKDRVMADEFAKELKVFITSYLRNTESDRKKAALIRLDALLNEKAPLLHTNVNLPLFFSAFVSLAKHIY